MSSDCADESGSPSDVELKLKTRLMTVWNTVKYSWNLKLPPNFSKDSPIWLLGKWYHKNTSSPARDVNLEIGTDIVSAEMQQDDDGDGGGIDDFRLDFYSRIWLTYRREFPILEGSLYSTDCGWGCMLRSGQMLLAQALICHFLGREWRWIPDMDPFADVRHRMIIKWFGDNPRRETSPFSIHILVEVGKRMGIEAGGWYGPTLVAHILKESVRSAAEYNSELRNVAFYVAHDCAVYTQDVEAEYDRLETGAEEKGLVLLVPVRLGHECLNPIYGECIKNLLTYENCMGIIGGSPKHSLYFVGFQDEKLIHLDPHCCRETVDVSAKDFPLASYHCNKPRKMSLRKMDPSCCVGFYFAKRCEWDVFVRSIGPCVSAGATSSATIFEVIQDSRSKASAPPIARRLMPHHSEDDSFEIL